LPSCSALLSLDVCGPASVLMVSPTSFGWAHRAAHPFRTAAPGSKARHREPVVKPKPENRHKMKTA
jgi:hypothetical protein